ncbi:MAG: hypothetical protein QW835_06300 [Candidatus Hadarchaeum sp.]
MFRVEDHPEVLSHLRKISPLFRVIGREIMIFCPYCGDAHRKPDPKHGHLYISMDVPVFHCFRCNTSGHLNRLLSDTDSEIRIEDGVRQFKVSNLFCSDPKEFCLAETMDFAKKNSRKFEKFISYMAERFGCRHGHLDLSTFLICPELIDGALYATFYNFEGKPIISRSIDSSCRYRKRSPGFYFFQEPVFDVYRELVIAEGPFDIISLYLYNRDFSNCFFVAACGKRYSGVVEHFLPDLLFGRHSIHMVFDKDVNEADSELWFRRVKKLVRVNRRIEVKRYRSVLKDPAELADVMEIV